MTDLPALLLAMLEERSADWPMPIHRARHELRWRSNLDTTERQIKAAIEQLRKAGHMIVARRGRPHGYYIARNADDLEHALRAYEQQIWTSLRTLRAMAPPARVRELVGQMRLEVEA